MNAHEPDQHPEDPQARSANQGGQEKLPQAQIHHAGWRWAIWAVPLAALIIVGYVMIRQWLASGPTVEVVFPTASGLSKDSEVRYRGVQVGRVTSVQVSDDLKDVVIKLSMHGSMSGALRADTRFWIAQPSLTGGSVTQLLGGAYIGIEPGTGPKTTRFTGTLEPPPLKPLRPGTAFVLYTDQAAGISQDSPVWYRGLQAGQVIGVAYEPKSDRVKLDVLVEHPFDHAVRIDSRFWQAGGIHLGGTGGQGLAIPPLSRLIEGGIAFETPKGPAAKPAQAGATFTLYQDRQAAQRPPLGPSVPFEIRVPGSIAGLRPGAPVKLRGVEVGQVQSVSMHYDRQHGTIETPVTIAIAPARLGLQNADGQTADERLLDAMASLVHGGLRAEIGSSSLLFGEKEVDLVSVHGQPDKQLDLATRPPRIPAIGGGDIQGLMASASGIADQIQSIPFAAIGANLKDVTAQARTFANSPELAASLKHADQTLANLQAISQDVRRQIQPFLTSLRRTADQVQGIADNLNSVTGGSLRSQQNLSSMIQELTQAARSVRVLADYLDRHPEALLEGRKR